MRPAADVVFNHEDEISLAAFLGAYSRGCSGGYLLSPEDAMDPAFADLRGDGGAELLHDLRATGIGSLAHVLRLRMAIIADCPAGALEAIDRFVSAAVRRRSAVRAQRVLLWLTCCCG